MSTIEEAGQDLLALCSPPMMLRSPGIPVAKLDATVALEDALIDHGEQGGISINQPGSG